MMQKHRDSDWLAQPRRHTMRRVLTEAVKDIRGVTCWEKNKLNRYEHTHTAAVTIMYKKFHKHEALKPPE